MSTDEPSNWELMRAINALDNKIDAKLCGIENCLWGPNRDDGLVTAVKVTSQKVYRLERIVYGLAGAATTALVGYLMGVIG